MSRLPRVVSRCQVGIRNQQEKAAIEPPAAASKSA
jgi:hypothetical protein